MARQPRLSVAGLPHLVGQRVVHGALLCVDAEDHEQLRADLRQATAAHGVALHAYVLMPDHLHLLATPAADGALGAALQALGRRYVRRFNLRHQRRGTLWQGRFRCAVLDPARHLAACARYVETNPVRAGIVAAAADYPWSSHAHHLGLRRDPLITEHEAMWALGNTPFERQAAWRRLCGEPPAPGELERIRAVLRGGWVLGEGDFVDELAGRIGNRRLGPRPPGRPPRAG